MKKRERIYNKFGGLCAYSGTPLEDDWQIDHLEPVVRNFGIITKKELDNEDNLVPCQKLINHYKGFLTLEEFRTWYLADLHLRLNKPKFTRVEATRKKKIYLNKIASYFGITEDNPFSGVFYFEKLREKQK